MYILGASKKMYSYEKGNKSSKHCIALQSLLKIDSVQFPVFLQMSDGFCTIALFYFQVSWFENSIWLCNHLEFYVPKQAISQWSQNIFEVALSVRTVTTPAATQWHGSAPALPTHCSKQYRITCAAMQSATCPSLSKYVLKNIWLSTRNNVLPPRNHMTLKYSNAISNSFWPHCCALQDVVIGSSWGQNVVSCAKSSTSRYILWNGWTNGGLRAQRRLCATALGGVRAAAELRRATVRHLA